MTTRSVRSSQLKARRATKSLDDNVADVIPLAMKLMKIPGPSGQEGRVSKFICAQLRRAGAPAQTIHSDDAHRRTPIQGETGNLVFKLPGTKRGPRRLLMAHLDTVPICVGSIPIRRGPLIVSANPNSGLGADDRAGAAVVLWTALKLLRNNLPHPPLTFLWSVQEETGIHGVRLIQRSLLGRPRMGFNWDGGAPDKLTIGATGGYRIKINVHGLASHAGGAPEQGISAITIAGRAIAELDRTGWLGLVQKKNRMGTSNIGIVRGGHATNVVTDHVVLRAEARSHHPPFRKRIVKKIEQAFREAARTTTSAKGKSGRVTFDGSLDYESFQLDEKEPALLAAENAVQAVGKTPLRTITNGGVDANWMVQHGIPTVSLGAGQRNQHTLDEALDTDELQTACRIALRLALYE